MSRGYYGVALYQPKNTFNWGTLLRTSNILGCDFISIVGARFKRQASDTLKTERHIPVTEYTNFENFFKHLPHGCRLIGVELTDDATLVEDFKHPQQACYIFGSEDNGLPKEVLDKCHNVIKLRGRFSMNLAVAGSIVLYERTKV